MLLPNQFQDLAVILNTNAEELEQVYTSADIDITDEMAILDILSDKIKISDFSKIKTILQNYPEFDDILYKMNIVEQVLNIEKLPSIHIVENLTPSVLDSFKGSELYNIFTESTGNNIIEKNRNIRKKIMETITPKKFLKPIMEGISISRDKKIMNESLSEYVKDLSEKDLVKRIRELHRLSSKTPYTLSDGSPNPIQQSLNQELKELEDLYNSKFGHLNEDTIEPIQPIQPIEPKEAEPKDGKSLSTNDEKDVMQMNDEEANEEIEDMLDANIDIDPTLIKRAFGDINPDELKDIYKDMDSEELQDHLEAIDEYLK